LVDEQECTLRGHSSDVNRVQFSDDGLQVISGSDDGTVLVSPILRANPAC
jgi:WD40 repeat protein